MAKTLTANMLDAKTRLSALVDLVERGELDEVVLARDGRAAARIVPLARSRRVRLGLAKGRFVMPASIDASDEEVRALFGLGTDAPAP
jgi:antitoxin (DNA-binding transcriptional repressor) of toxin-antitoxin stability system